jgi:hypothetical protein
VIFIWNYHYSTQLKSFTHAVFFKSIKEYSYYSDFSIWYGKVQRDSEQRIENEVPTFVFCPWELCVFISVCTLQVPLIPTFRTV